MGRARLPRVSILVESGRDGLEVHVCRKICQLLRDQHGAAFEERIVPVDNKARLMEEAASVAENLFGEGFQRVVILWDEEPVWPQTDQDYCWFEEREHLLAALRTAGLSEQQVFLVCIERAFEAWLMFDEQWLSQVISRETHRVRVKTPRHADRLKNVKGKMMTLFRKHGRTYVDAQLARPLANVLQNLARLRRCSTFRRFAEKITGMPFEK